MGNNTDLVWLLGLPEKTKCPRCTREVDTYFNEYDIECGDPSFKKNGCLKLHCYCDECEYEFYLKFKIEEQFELEFRTEGLK